MHIKLLSLLLFSLTSTSMVIIDVRTEDEWKNGHLDGAVNIEWQDILKIPSTINKDEEIYLYCRSGNRSGKANKILIDAGYQNTINAGSIKEASELLGINIVN
jgi:phage shock protein E